MNLLFDILLVLLAIGLVAGVANERGIFPSKIPSNNISVSTSTVTEIQSGASSQTANDFSVWEVIQSFMRIVGTMLTAVFLVGLLIYNYLISAGVPASDAFTYSFYLIQPCVTFVTLFGLYEWWTGRSVT
jgi:hypothetical protein